MRMTTATYTAHNRLSNGSHERASRRGRRALHASGRVSRLCSFHRRLSTI